MKKEINYYSRLLELSKDKNKIWVQIDFKNHSILLKMKKGIAILKALKESRLLSNNDINNLDEKIIVKKKTKNIKLNLNCKVKDSDILCP